MTFSYPYRVKREAEEVERKKREEAEAAEKARAEAAKKEKEGAKKALKKERKQLRTLCKDHDYYAQVNLILFRPKKQEISNQTQMILR